MDSAHKEWPSGAYERLLRAVVAISNSQANLGEQRKELLTELALLIGADAGFWAWGRGWPATHGLSPVALIDVGMNDQQRGTLIAWAMSTDCDCNFRGPIMAQLGPSRRGTHKRGDIVPDETWQDHPVMRQQLGRAGWENWLHSVRYDQSDTWCNFLWLRNTGRPEFSRAEAVLVDTVLNGVSWMHSGAEEYLPPQTFAGLTARQRTVMLLLLDGLPCKQIAARLAIREETVGDHIKSIYAHFGVNSAMELAGVFLRGR